MSSVRRQAIVQTIDNFLSITWKYKASMKTLSELLILKKLPWSMSSVILLSFCDWGRLVEYKLSADWLAQGSGADGHKEELSIWIWIHFVCSVASSSVWLKRIWRWSVSRERPGGAWGWERAWKSRIISSSPLPKMERRGRPRLLVMHLLRHQRKKTWMSYWLAAATVRVWSCQEMITWPSVWRSWSMRSSVRRMRMMTWALGYFQRIDSRDMWQKCWKCSFSN